MENKRNILIIGGNSFIAQQFIVAHKNTFNIKSVSRKKTNFENEFIIPNLFNIPDSVFKDIEVVINCAAIVHQPKIKNNEVYELINFKLPIFLAEMAIKNGCKHFIQLSTIAVYGNAQIINKETSCTPNSLYGNSKLKADIDLSKLANKEFIITSIRPSMVYGSKNAPGNMISLINLVKKNMPLPFGSIQNKRQFLHVDNLNQALKGIILNKISGIIILADEESISIEKIVRIISKTLNFKSKLIKIPMFWKIMRLIKPQIAHKLIDDLIIENTYSFKELGVVKPHSVEEGIKAMIINFK